MSASPSAAPAFYASVGPELTRYEVDVRAASLTARETVALPEKVQYAWRHPTRRLLYVAVSNGGPGRSGVRGDRHLLCTYAADGSGRLSPHGAPAALAQRPIHLTVDAAGRHVLVAYNNPSALTVHRIGEDGTAGAAVPQGPLDVGVFAHQIRQTPAGGGAVLVTRGNNAEDGRPEDPGALKVYLYADGRLTDRASVAPAGGFGFGPRHLDFHPTSPWAYVSVERQNQLQMYRLDGDALEPAPAWVVTTLERPEAATERQHGGAVRVHPSGRFVYMTNRSDLTETVDGAPVFAGGENAVAVFAIDPGTGEPRRIQSAPTHGFVPRTMSLDPEGRMLVAGNQEAMRVREGAAVRTVPASLAVYRVGEDGRLGFVRTYEVATDGSLMFWSGFVDWS